MEKHGEVCHWQREGERVRDLGYRSDEIQIQFLCVKRFFKRNLIEYVLGLDWFFCDYASPLIFKHGSIFDK